MLDYLPEIESDLSATHRYRVDATADGGWECGAGEWDGLSARRFFQLAERLAAYPGMIQTILLNDERERQEGGYVTDERLTTRRGRTDGGGGTWDGVEIIPLTREMVATGASHIEGLDGLIEVRRVVPAA